MRRIVLLGLFLLSLAAISAGQGPVFNQNVLWTLPYEDLSDLLRRYPGMYPVDYGTMGAPLLIRPWELPAWELRVLRDGIPQNRRYDGLFDINLQPPGELDTIRYSFLGGGGAGTFSLKTRVLPVDTPYTEFQIREGFYGYGTVDFAHAQRIYRSLTLEMTGRLVWYDGMRTPSASRFNRVRGKVGFSLGSRWRGDFTYAGSNVRSDFVLNPAGYYSEREEAILHLSRRDSSRSEGDPHIRFYLRQDREKWEPPFRAREAQGGWVVETHVALPRQCISLRHSASLSEINFPGFDRRRESALEFRTTDRYAVGRLSLEAGGGLRRESDWRHDREGKPSLLPDGSARIELRSGWNLTLHSGVEYTEERVPIAWTLGRYRIGYRPLIIEPEFSNLFADLLPSPDSQGAVNRYLKTAVGLRWERKAAQCAVELMTIDRPGHFLNEFTLVDTTGVRFESVRRTAETQLGLAGEAIVPLVYGLRVESWWFAQAPSSDVTRTSDSRGYTRLYFEKSFFTSPLTIRSHISWEYIGRRNAFSYYGSGRLGQAALVGFRVSATIRGVTLMWGTENFFRQVYSLMPGYPMIGKEEYLAFIWRIWF